MCPGRIKPPSQTHPAASVPTPGRAHLPQPGSARVMCGFAPVSWQDQTPFPDSPCSIRVSWQDQIPFPDSPCSIHAHLGESTPAPARVTCGFAPCVLVGPNFLPGLIHGHIPDFTPPQSSLHQARIIDKMNLALIWASGNTLLMQINHTEAWKAAGTGSCIYLWPRVDPLERWDLQYWTLLFLQLLKIKD